MSMRLKIEFQDPSRKALHIDVAFLSDFNAEWQAGALHLHLDLLAMSSDTGINLDQSNVDDFQRELKTLKQYWVDSPQADTPSIEIAIRIVDKLISDLQIIRDDPIAKGSISFS